ncbi:MAG: hypothetical protein SV760_00175, partial [Halobacteria archaeon]|nr:hypothetical protein [Halobacteria archaeon]
FTASEDEVEEAISEVADELGQSEEKVRSGIEDILDSADSEVSTSFNESVAGTSFENDEVGEDDPRLEALELYKLRQKI